MGLKESFETFKATRFRDGKQGNYGQNSGSIERGKVCLEKSFNKDRFENFNRVVVFEIRSATGGRGNRGRMHQCGMGKEVEAWSTSRVKKATIKRRTRKGNFAVKK